MMWDSTQAARTKPGHGERSNHTSKRLEKTN